MTNAVNAVRFGAWVLRDINVGKGTKAGQKPKEVTLTLAPESQADFQFQTLPGLSPGTKLNSRTVQLKLAKDEKGALQLNSRYVTDEKYSYQQATYTKEWVSAGRDMCDTWQDAHYEDRYTGEETIWSTRDKSIDTTSTVDKLDRFQDLYALLDSLKADRPLLVKAAQTEGKPTPALTAAFKTLEVTTDRVKNQLLGQGKLDPLLDEALVKDADTLKEQLVKPARVLLKEQGRALSKTLRQEAQDKVTSIREQLLTARASAGNQVALLKLLVQRTTRKPKQE
jgi:hypothetical protein